MVTSQETKQISNALVNFHKEVRKVSKDAKNPFFKSRYASLSNILDTIDEPLINNGLAIVQFPEGEHALTSRLIHVSGEWMEGHYEMKPVKDTPQDRGSALTYARRYAIAAILSLNVDEDDDGNKASGREVGRKDVPTREEKNMLLNLMNNSTLNQEQRDAAQKAINECFDYTVFQQIQHKLEDKQIPFDQIKNPSQRDISNHVKKVVG